MSNLYYGRPVFEDEPDPFYGGSYGHPIFDDEPDPFDAKEQAYLGLQRPGSVQFSAMRVEEKGDPSDTGACILYRRLAAVISLIIVAIITVSASALEYGAGNIDLDNRVVVENGDGSFSTELSFSVEMDGEIWLLPSIVNGTLLAEDDAIHHFLQSGEYLGRFETIDECDAYAEWLHLRQEAMYSVDR